MENIKWRIVFCKWVSKGTRTGEEIALAKRKVLFWLFIRCNNVSLNVPVNLTLLVILGILNTEVFVLTKTRTFSSVVAIPLKSDHILVF